MSNKSRSAKRRTKVKNLPKPEKELPGQTMKKISGGFLGGIGKVFSGIGNAGASAPTDTDPSRKDK